MGGQAVVTRILPQIPAGTAGARRLTQFVLRSKDRLLLFRVFRSFSS